MNFENSRNRNIFGVLAEFSRFFLFETNDNYYDYDEKEDDDDGKGATKQRV